MGLLPKYQTGKRIGIDPSSLSQEVKDLGSYTNDINPKGYFIEGSEGWKHNDIPNESDSPARRYFKSISLVNKPKLNKSGVNLC